MNGGRVYKLFIAVLLCTISTSVHAGLVNVQEISVSFPVAYYYQGSAGATPGYFHITNTSTIVGNIQTVGASGYDYGLSATVNVDNCNLVDDNSSDGWAEGEFAGGATISLVGDLWDVSAPGTLLIDDGVILQAQMVLTSSQTWTLSEVGGDPRDIDGTMDFIPTNGGLNSGIDLGNGDSLVIGNFRADFGFPNTQPVDPTSFGAISYFAMASTLQMTAIPEPSTVVLLSIGALGFLRKRRG